MGISLTFMFIMEHDRGTGADSGLVAFPAEKGPLAES
jgi:hypothetical protein